MMDFKRTFARIILALALASPSGAMSPALPATTHPAAAHPEAQVFDATAAVWGQVNRALLAAKANQRLTVIVMGANWCHDSRALAGWLETSRFQTMMKPHYEIVYVDVGTPQTGKGRNLDIAKHYGIKRIKGTPTLIIIGANGKRINTPKDAASWRDASIRIEDDIFQYFNALARMHAKKVGHG
jgi:thiol-disulfide isomerase/thioredoxin